MMILKHLTMQIIPMAISFGVAYWLLVTAEAQETALQIIGKILGWLLIVVTLITMIFTYTFSIKMYKEGRMFYGHHMQKMMDHKGMPMMKKEDNEEQEDIQNNETPEQMDKEEMNENMQNKKEAPAKK